MHDNVCALGNSVCLYVWVSELMWSGCVLCFFAMPVSSTQWGDFCALRGWLRCDLQGAVHTFVENRDKDKYIHATSTQVVPVGKPVTSLCFSTWYSAHIQNRPVLLANACVDQVILLTVEETGSLVAVRRFPIVQRSRIIRSSLCPLISLREGACFVSGSEDGDVYVFDLMSNKKSCVNRLQGHSGPVLDVSWCYDESLLATCDESGVVIVWSRGEREVVEKHFQTLREEEEEIQRQENRSSGGSV